jgi:hypothetical protein
VPKGNLIPLLEHQPELVKKASYEVQSSVPLEMFEIFVNHLETGTKVSVTKENAFAISLLAKEFGLVELLSECSSRYVVSLLDFIVLSERMTKLEHQISCLDLAVAPQLKESIANHEQQLQSLRSVIETKTATLRTEIDQLRHSAQLLQTELETLKSTTKPGPDPDPEIHTPSSPPHPVPPVSPSPALPPIQPAPELPLNETKSLDGIISYLTRKHGGNVHDKGIVTITSKSIEKPCYPPRNAADLTTDIGFHSMNEPDQWICWDFHDMRLRPTCYTRRSCGLKSWLVESSLDGETWTVIDRKKDNKDFKELNTASFAFWKLAECRFIRLTMTGKRHESFDTLSIYAFEVFETLN